MSKKLLTVFGATGNQGGSVISVLLAHPTLATKYSVRAITRDTSKPAAQALKSKGCEVVAADMSDASSLGAAVAGSYGVFAVTNYWETVSKEVELKQGKAIADACLQHGVRHLVWSALPHTTKLTGGALPNIDHFVAKAEVAEYIEANKHAAKIEGGGSMWASYTMPAFFMSNIPSSIRPSQAGDGTLSYAAPFDPNSQFALIDIRSDTGKFVLGALEAGKDADGKHIQAVSEWTTPTAVAETFTKYGGAGEVKFVPLPRETFKGFLVGAMGEFAAEELAQNMELVKDWSYYGKGTEKEQAESDRFLLQGAKKTTLRGWVEAGKPWDFGGK